MAVIDKKSLRRQQIQRLQQLVPAVKQKQEDLILRQLYDSALFQAADSIGVTFSSGIEFATGPLIKTAWQAHKTIYLPRTYPESHEMHFFRYQANDELERSAFGIMEPQAVAQWQNDQPELLIVPGLAYSRDRWRVGFGGGYYDRFLRGYQGTTIVLGLPAMVFSEPNWPLTKFDQQFDHLLTIEEDA
ncbi:5-formyltetrahydrofolate cyclo-ligase [Lapidilactobacillus luobeiensis]|uniref:5-formyltetrahydrofolate cyclo-ligase n=1 Tax=Lapidilactobacillus luobeiensis TaxID=2950371 RepID=UPI0021C4B019|nr:5-formyltetrahydrofolate cyclo-ligase [Lapidilactobacillus luobeiensis]